MEKDKNEMSIDELLTLIKQLSISKKYTEIIKILDNDILEKHNNSLFYSYRGWAKWEINDTDGSIKDCDTAIKIDKNNQHAYNNRGIAKQIIGKYDDSIKDLNEAIKIAPEYTEAYINRGVAWRKKKEYKKAINDYNKAIKLNPKKAYTYNNIGVVYEEKKDYRTALRNYEKAIELNKDYELAKRNRERIMTILGEEYKKIATDSYDLFNESVEKLTQQEKADILLKCKYIIEDIVEKIREHAYSKMDEELKYEDFYLATHYSKLKTADVFISFTENENTKSKMRYYNAVYMNDPEEGQVILNCLKDNNEDSIIVDAFNAGSKEEENAIYLGSFLPAKLHEDELIMWRTYGKDEHKTEAAGCSIIIDMDFFDKETKLTRLQKGISPDTDIKTEENNTTQPLYRVIYYDKNEGVGKRYHTKNGDCEKITADMELLKKALKELIDLKKTNPSAEKDNAINKIVYLIISEIRYFFKSADYAFENEVRVVQFVPSENEKVKIDDNGGQWLPKRLYVESNKPILPYIRKIILGPKVPNPNQWLYLEAAMKQKKYYNFKLYNSKQKFQ